MITTVTDYRPSDTTPTLTLGAALDERFDRVLAVLERLRGVQPAAERDVEARLAHAAVLLAEFDTLRADLELADPADRPSAVAARVGLDLYDGAVRELRGVAGEARRGVERAEEVFAEALLFARRRRRRAERLTARSARASAISADARQ